MIRIMMPVVHLTPLLPVSDLKNVSTWFLLHRVYNPHTGPLHKVLWRFEVLTVVQMSVFLLGCGAMWTHRWMGGSMDGLIDGSVDGLIDR
jgi:hypothetical protein